MGSNAHRGIGILRQASLWHSRIQSCLCKVAPRKQSIHLTSFSDTHDLSLSPYQQQFFQGWIRAADAVPAPATFSGDRHGIGPLMSSSRPIDLVQDAASDCSVVTSLCAAIARAERGHDQVSSMSEPVLVLC
jgi:hypothetical protein